MLSLPFLTLYSTSYADQLGESLKNLSTEFEKRSNEEEKIDKSGNEKEKTKTETNLDMKKKYNVTNIDNNDSGMVIKTEKKQLDESGEIIKLEFYNTKNISNKELYINLMYILEALQNGLNKDLHSEVKFIFKDPKIVENKENHVVAIFRAVTPEENYQEISNKIKEIFLDGNLDRRKENIKNIIEKGAPLVDVTKLINLKEEEGEIKSIYDEHMNDFEKMFKEISNSFNILNSGSIFDTFFSTEEDANNIKDNLLNELKMRYTGDEEIIDLLKKIERKIEEKSNKEEVKVSVSLDSSKVLIDKLGSCDLLGYFRTAGSSNTIEANKPLNMKEKFVQM